MIVRRINVCGILLVSCIGVIVIVNYAIQRLSVVFIWIVGIGLKMEIQVIICLLVRDSGRDDGVVVVSRGEFASRS